MSLPLLLIAALFLVISLFTPQEIKILDLSITNPVKNSRFTQLTGIIIGILFFMAGLAPIIPPSAWATLGFAAPCKFDIDPRFKQIGNEAIASSLKCALSASSMGVYSEQRFEKGFLIWFMKDERTYEFLNSGEWYFYTADYMNGQPADTCTDLSAKNMLQLGFLRFWCSNRTVQMQLGKPIETEGQSSIPIQFFDGGFIFYSERQQKAIGAVYSNNRWVAIQSSPR